MVAADASELIQNLSADYQREVLAKAELAFRGCTEAVGGLHAAGASPCSGKFCGDLRDLAHWAHANRGDALVLRDGVHTHLLSDLP